MLLFGSCSGGGAATTDAAEESAGPAEEAGGVDEAGNGFAATMFGTDWGVRTCGGGA